jgi:hypothetical protein
MSKSHAVRIALLVLLASGAIGCNLSIDQIFAMKDGSSLQTFLVSNDGTLEIPQGVMTFEGGAVMHITISSNLLDYLDGTVNGDVALPDLLFAIPGMRFFLFDTGLICVALGDPPGGGSFEYKVLPQTAAFDVTVNTEALPVDPVYQRSMKDGKFLFPFHLQSEIPLSLIDALGLFTGTGSMEVSQHIDQRFDVQVRSCPNCTDYLTFHFGVRGDIALASTDTFPATPKVLQCVDFLAGQGT